jgi:Trk K+ transport system NAD-binding subunit
MIYGEDGFENSDTKSIKALLSIKSRADIAKVPSPKVVVEILEQNNVDVARAAYGENIQVISGRVLLARMIAQSIQNPGLSYVITELIAQSEGSEIYLKVYDELVGKSWGEIKDAFPNCIAIGLVSNFQRDRCVVNPRNSEIILDGDFIIFIATTFDSINFDKKLLKKNEGLIENETLKDVIKKPKKLLIMGWSMKAPFLIKELYETQKYDFEIDILSQVEVPVREKSLLSVLNQGDYSAIRHIVADYTSFNDISNIEFSRYDNVVFLSSDRTSDATDADARSILGILQLRQVVGVNKEFPVVIELAEPENEKLFENRQGETIISPMVISYILSNVALRFELNRVFDSLFNAGGSDITFISAKHFGLSGSLCFEEISKIVCSFNMIAIGLKKNDQKEIFLNPSRVSSFTDLESYKIIVIN